MVAESPRPSSGTCSSTSLRVRFETSSPDGSEPDVRPNGGPFALRELRHGSLADWGGRKKMEDVVFVVESIEEYCGRSFEGAPDVKAFFAVFDGHAGVAAAEFAQRTLLRCITRHERFPDDIELCIRDGFLETERLFFASWRARQSPDAGTTALCLLVWGETLYVGNLGDSRAVLCRGGKTLPLTRDHRPDCTREAARIAAAGGFVTPDHRLNGCLSVSRAIGDYSEAGLKRRCGAGELLPGAGPLSAEPETHVHVLTAADEFLVMACDGLWDQFSNERVIELARESLKAFNDPQECVADLVREANSQHAADNVTAIALCFSSEAPRRRTFSFRRTMSDKALSQLQTAFAEAASLAGGAKQEPPPAGATPGGYCGNSPRALGAASAAAPAAVAGPASAAPAAAVCSNSR